MIVKAYAFGLADPMVAMLFLVLVGEYLENI
jgi:hypothetical protein